MKGRAIPLLSLWAVRPVQSLSACKKLRFTFTFYLSKSHYLYFMHLNTFFFGEKVLYVSPDSQWGLWHKEMLRPMLYNPIGAVYTTKFNMQQSCLFITR